MSTLVENPKTGFLATLFILSARLIETNHISFSSSCSFSAEMIRSLNSKEKMNLGQFSEDGILLHTDQLSQTDQYLSCQKDYFPTNWPISILDTSMGK